ncbi:MAG: response regulator transcription factor, partial [bacterium]
MVKILIVEDEVEIAQNLMQILKNQIQNIEVYWAKCIRESRQMVIKEKPQLVILDINLPDGRGTDLYKEYKELYPDGIVIFLTSIDSDIEKIVALELGADDYITKPFNVNELLAKIKNWIKRISKEKKEFIPIIADYYFDKTSGMIFLHKQGFFNLIETLSY